MTATQPLRALALNCTLKPSPDPSSSQLLAQQILDALGQHDVAGHMVRVCDFDVRPGVRTDMGGGDQWSQLRNEDGAHKIAADVFQALNDIGFSIPAQGNVYWNAEAMTGTDFKDLDSTPKAVVSTTKTLAATRPTWPNCCRRSSIPCRSGRGWAPTGQLSLVSSIWSYTASNGRRGASFTRSSGSLVTTA